MSFDAEKDNVTSISHSVSQSCEQIDICNPQLWQTFICCHGDNYSFEFYNNNLKVLQVILLLFAHFFKLLQIIKNVMGLLQSFGMTTAITHHKLVSLLPSWAEKCLKRTQTPISPPLCQLSLIRKCTDQVLHRLIKFRLLVGLLVTAR